MKNIAAYTAPGNSHPEYISVNQDMAGSVGVTVRDVRGNHACVVMPRDEFAKLLAEMTRKFSA